MSNTESFIDEVNEEVRRDRLFAYFKRYGWIAVLLVLLLVGGAAWREYSAASAAAEAQREGDALLSALDGEDAAARAEALSGVEIDGASAAVVRLLQAGAQQEAGEAAKAADTLQALASDEEAPQLYRELATLKRAMVAPELSPEEREQILQPLSQPGEPFRLLAKEQIALAQIAGENTEGALETLRGITEDAAVTQGLRQRVQALIVALGGETDAEAPAAAAASATQ